MNIRRRLLVGVILSLGLVCPMAARAHDGLGWFRRPLLSGPANYPPNATHDAAIPPGHERIRIDTVQPDPVFAKTPPKAYNWGYFGASPRPSVTEEHFYYNNFRQWSFRPGE